MPHALLEFAIERIGQSLQVEDGRAFAVVQPIERPIIRFSNGDVSQKSWAEK